MKMIGVNELELNQATMRLALCEWINKHLASDAGIITVCEVIQNSNGCFTVVVESKPIEDTKK